jgi:hypothetical protein
MVSGAPKAEIAAAKEKLECLPDNVFPQKPRSDVC